MMLPASGRLPVQNYTFCDTYNVWAWKRSLDCSRCPAALLVQRIQPNHLS